MGCEQALVAGFAAGVAAAAPRPRRGVAVGDVEFAATAAAVELTEIDKARTLLVRTFLAVHTLSILTVLTL